MYNTKDCLASSPFHLVAVFTAKQSLPFPPPSNLLQLTIKARQEGKQSVPYNR